MPSAPQTGLKAESALHLHAALQTSEKAAEVYDDRKLAPDDGADVDGEPNAGGRDRIFGPDGLL